MSRLPKIPQKVFVFRYEFSHAICLGYPLFFFSFSVRVLNLLNHVPIHNSNVTIRQFYQIYLHRDKVIEICFPDLQIGSSGGSREWTEEFFRNHNRKRDLPKHNASCCYRNRLNRKLSFTRFQGGMYWNLLFQIWILLWIEYET